MRDVYVIGAYTTAFKKHPGMSFADLAREAYLGTLSDAAMKNGTDIEADLHARGDRRRGGAQVRGQLGDQRLERDAAIFLQLRIMVAVHDRERVDPALD